MNPAFAQMLATAGLGAHALGYVALAVTLCSGLDALLPQPAAGSHWLVPRKLLSLIALNLGNATNGKQPAFASWLLRVALPLIQAQQAAQAQQAPRPAPTPGPIFQPQAAPAAQPPAG